MKHLNILYSSPTAQNVVSVGEAHSLELKLNVELYEDNNKKAVETSDAYFIEVIL